MCVCVCKGMLMDARVCMNGCEPTCLYSHDPSTYLYIHRHICVHAHTVVDTFYIQCLRRCRRRAPRPDNADTFLT